MAPRRNLPHHDRGLERVQTLPGGGQPPAELQESGELAANPLGMIPEPRGREQLKMAAS